MYILNIASHYTYELTTADYIIQYIRDTHIGNINYQDCIRRESTLSIHPTSKFSKLDIKNPVDDFLIFNSHLEGNLTIFDMFGRIINRFENEKNIFVGDLTAGFYIVQLQHGQETLSGRFLKN